MFWKKGYEGASLPDLTKAMGINRPSLYAAFGNKESLFRKVVERYVEKLACFVREALAEPTARGVIEKLLKGSVCQQTQNGTTGCLLVQAALACDDAAEPIRKELATRRCAVEQALRERFERAIAEGDLAEDSDPAALAKFIATFQHGLAVQLSGAASREALLGAIDVGAPSLRRGKSKGKSKKEKVRRSACTSWTSHADWGASGFASRSLSKSTRKNPTDIAKRTISTFDHFTFNFFLLPFSASPRLRAPFRFVRQRAFASLFMLGAEP